MSSRRLHAARTTMGFVVIAYFVIAVLIAVRDYRKPHSETFSQSQHLQNSIIGAILWPAGAILLAVAYTIGVVSGRAAPDQHIRTNRPFDSEEGKHKLPVNSN